VAHRQDGGVELVEDGFEQLAGKHRRAEVAHAFGVDRIVVGLLLRSGPERHFEIGIEPLAYFGPLLARYRQ
jgi:hypothetical protein